MHTPLPRMANGVAEDVVGCRTESVGLVAVKDQCLELAAESGGCWYVALCGAVATELFVGAIRTMGVAAVSAKVTMDETAF